MKGRFIEITQLVGNIGIIIGLVFVGLQMNQDRELKRAELSWAALDSLREQYIAMLGENPQQSAVKATINPEEMTPEDALIMHNLFRADIYRVVQSSIMVDLGIFPEDFRQSIGLSGYFDTQIGQRWLAGDQLRSAPIPPDYRLALIQGRSGSERSSQWIDYLLSKNPSDPYAVD